MSMIVNRRDLDFLFYEVLGVDKLFEKPRYADYDRQAINAILDTAQQIAEEKFLPCAAKLDANEPSFDGKTVSIIPEVSDALHSYREAGFFGASFDLDDGGLQMPLTVSTAVGGIFTCANCGISSYPFLTIGAANLLRAFGNEEQKQRFLAPMIEGRWFGTMCLSEPQAGSSLSDIATKAEPQKDGHYKITGTKMWISGGDHELSENIVHMVLAKIPGAPPGVKGISLFLVPKYRINDDGVSVERNDVTLAGLNHKMGHRGTTNTMLSFGESGECHGYLVGKPHNGLRYMFHMMNEARVGVGYGAVMSGLAGYLYSLDYARNRPQGRHPHDKDPTTAQLMIIEHADIRRLLLAQKASVEGALCLLTYCAYLIDCKKVTEDIGEQERLDLLLDILTPIAKSWPSEFCLEANKYAMQILGGYGYTRDYPVERFYRDNRLNPIHEGTHAIHGIDLLGRKVRIDNGRALKTLLEEMENTAAQAEEIPQLDEYAAELREAVGVLVKTTQIAADCENLNLGLANATLYLDAFGHVVTAWMWLKQALATVNSQTTEGQDDKLFYEGKLSACRYFFRYELPKVYAQFRLTASLDDTCLSADFGHVAGH